MNLLKKGLAFYNPLVYNNLASEKDSIYRGIAKW